MHFEHRVVLPTQGMVEKAFIYGRLTIDLYDKQGGTRYVSMSDILIRQTKDKSRFYPEVPQRRYEQGGQTKYSNIIFLFPDNKDWWKKWTEKAVQDWEAECRKQGIAPGGWVAAKGSEDSTAPKSNEGSPTFGDEPVSSEPAAAGAGESAQAEKKPDDFPF